MIYVDNSKIYIGRSICCHMFADTEDELHKAAAAIGLGRFAYTRGEVLAHYNVCWSKRKKAVALGAAQVDQHWLRERIAKAMEAHRGYPRPMQA